jgi:hypothetical protein
MECPNCEHKENRHNPACPKARGTVEAQTEYDRGYMDGLKGERFSEDPTYQLGYNNGIHDKAETQE